jgi:cation-dependent mannose-6-phosphate receptor
VLNYTNGSPCGKEHKRRHTVTELTERSEIQEEHPTRRKSTTISLLCDQETLAPSSPKVMISFVGTDDDECSYFFEARSYAACAGIESSPQTLGPGGVFGVMYERFSFE